MCGTGGKIKQIAAGVFEVRMVLHDWNWRSRYKILIKDKGKGYLVSCSMACTLLCREWGYRLWSETDWNTPPNLNAFLYDQTCFAECHLRKSTCFGSATWTEEHLSSFGQFDSWLRSVEFLLRRMLRWPRRMLDKRPWWSYSYVCWT